MIEGIDHVNLVVGDMQPMLAFYRDLLGLRLTKQATIRGPWIEAVRRKKPRPMWSFLKPPLDRGSNY